MSAQSQTLRGRFAARLFREHITQQLTKRTSGDIDVDELLHKFEGISPPKAVGATPKGTLGKVCIVGAGAAGIYLAWMLSFLKIDYDLLEASDRIGGRVFTYKDFTDDQEADGICAHNYYDVGAMRIPIIDSNMPTIDVIKCLNVPTADYYLENALAPNMFGRQKFDSQEIDTAMVPLKSAIGEWADKLNSDFNNTFDELIKLGFDKMSTREYLRKMGIEFNEAQILETLDTGTGLFDQALTESILDYADFPANAKWLRVEGGMIELINAMYKQISKPATLNTTVRAYKMNRGDVDVTSTDRSGMVTTNTYAAVFNSTTLGALGRIDLGDDETPLGSDNQLTAIRSLAYDQATKVAIKFKTAWWITLQKGGMPKPDGNKGGISATDMPIRVVAYPPWMDVDDAEKPSVIIASYTWHQDAVRIGSLTKNWKDGAAKPEGAPKDFEAIQLVLKNLATLFNANGASITYEFLLDQVIDWHSYAWHNDPLSSGAFALFGPGQFTSLYPSLFSPLAGSNNNIYMIGEHASAHHAWIAGALDSAATSLYGWLLGQGLKGRSFASALKFADPKKYPFGGAIGHHRKQDEEKSQKLANGAAKMVSMEATVNGVGKGGVPDEMEENVVYWMAQLSRFEPTDDILKDKPSVV